MPIHDTDLSHLKNYKHGKKTLSQRLLLYNMGGSAATKALCS